MGIAALAVIAGCSIDPGEEERSSALRQGMVPDGSSTTTVATTTGAGGCGTGTGGGSSAESTTATTGSGACPVAVIEDLYACIDPGPPVEECGALGLVPIGKDDELGGLAFTATMDAYVAIVASGRGSCPRGSRSAAIYVDVEEGDLLHAPGTQGISHVTYCGCPAGAEPDGPY